MTKAKHTISKSMGHYKTFQSAIGYIDHDTATLLAVDGGSVGH